MARGQHALRRLKTVHPVRLLVVALQELLGAAAGVRRRQGRSRRPPARDRGSELRSLAEELGIAGDVVWVGGVPLEQTVHFYRCADAFVYPSFNETFGLPILEAMASACPVVTSDTSAMPETAGGCALLADPHDPQALADAIVKACGPEGERLRAAGPGRAGQFTWAATAERTLSVYRDVYAGRADRGGCR
jgi:glycosyltransferase involved in cell wall biosynthesis